MFTPCYVLTTRPIVVDNTDKNTIFAFMKLTSIGRDSKESYQGLHIKGDVEVQGDLIEV